MLPKAINWLDIEDEDAFLAFRHRRNFQDSRAGGVTFCFLVEPSYNRARFSVAVCSDKDNFSRAIGRQIAFGRLSLSKYYTIEDYSNEYELMEQARDVLLDKSEEDAFATKVINAYGNYIL